MILLVGSRNDPQIQQVAAALHRRKHETVLIDAETYGTSWFTSFCPLTGNITINNDNEEMISIPRTQSAGYWHQFRSEIPPNLSQRDAARRHADITSTLSPLFHHSGITWVNPLSALHYHHDKPRQLAHARRLGLTIPATYVGNSTAEALKFIQRHSALIMKPVKGGAHTQRVSEALSKPEALKAILRFAPVTLQEFIPGDDIRTYVFNQQVFGMQIHSSATDYREDHHATATSLSLPKDVATAARAVCNAFGMLWCAIDWRRDPHGGYYFLEANPAPYFLKAEAQTGLPITAALCDLLQQACAH